MISTLIELLRSPAAMALFVSVVIGVGVTLIWSELCHWILRRQYPQDFSGDPDRSRWIAVTVGILERLLFTILTIWLPQAVGPLAGTWIVAKSAGGWGTFRQNDLAGRSRYYVTLMGSIVSATWAYWVRDLGTASSATIADPLWRAAMMFIICDDDPDALWLRLDEIKDNGERVISVMWLPPRTVGDGAAIVDVSSA